MDSGALEICLVMRVVSVFNFFMSVSDISVIEKSSKANGQKQLLRRCSPFYEKTGGLFMYSALFPDL